MGEYYGVRMKDDPDGEYLQHWGVPKGFQRKAHKYLARLVTPSGYRYIYNQAQLAAAKAGRAISGAASSTANAVGNAIGINQRNRAQAATARARRISGGRGREQSVQAIKRGRMANATAKRAQNAYDKTLLGRAEKAFNSVRKSVGGALDDAGRYASKQARNIQKSAGRMARGAGKAVGDATGYNQRQTAQKANARAKRIAGEKTGREQNMTTIKRSRMANKTAKRAQSAYDRTPLGRAEKARENAGRAISGAGRAISDAVNRPLRNAIGNTATMKRIDQAQAKRKRQPERTREYMDIARRATDRFIRQPRIDAKTNVGRYAPKKKRKALK